MEFKIHFFLKRKQSRNIQCKTIKIPLFLGFDGFPLLRIKSESRHTVTAPASDLSTLQASSHSKTFALRSQICLQPLPLPSFPGELRLTPLVSARFTLPRNVCLPSWACVTAALAPNTREGLSHHLCPV